MPDIILHKDFGVFGIVVISIGNGHYLRAVRKLVGSALVVSIGSRSPERDHFITEMLFVKTLQTNDWIPVGISTWTQKYKDVYSFIRDYPMFKPLFDVNVPDKIIEVTDVCDWLLPICQRHPLEEGNYFTQGD